MQYTPDLEIPASVREIATKSVEQAKDAYDRFVDAARQAQDMIAKSTEVFTFGAKELQEKALAYAEANTRAGFDAASRLVKARDVKEALTSRPSMRATRWKPTPSRRPSFPGFSPLPPRRPSRTSTPDWRIRCLARSAGSIWPDARMRGNGYDPSRQ